MSSNKASAGYDNEMPSLESVTFNQTIPMQADFLERGNNGSSWESDYDRIHIQFPFLPINPPVGAVNSVVVATGELEKTMNMPDGAQLVRFKSASNFYINFNGAATLPSGDVINGSGSILNPEGWYYCKNKKSVSVYSATNGARITAEFFIQL